MSNRVIDLQNVADTISQISNPYIEAEPVSESMEYEVTDQELQTRKIVRNLFLVGVLTLIGVFIYSKYKK